jgi:hypothetical protein
VASKRADQERARRAELQRRREEDHVRSTTRTEEEEALVPAEAREAVALLSRLADKLESGDIYDREEVSALRAYTQMVDQTATNIARSRVARLRLDRRGEA